MFIFFLTVGLSFEPFPGFACKEFSSIDLPVFYELESSVVSLREILVLRYGDDIT